MPQNENKVTSLTDAPSDGLRTYMLVLEDDPLPHGISRLAFSDQTSDVTISDFGRSGLDAFGSKKSSAVILLLPTPVGQELWDVIRAECPGIRVIAVNAITETQDRVLLEPGRDDHVRKPFSPQGLMARVQTTLRRERKPFPVATYRFGDCKIDFAKMSAKRAGKPVRLTAHQFKMLRHFIENAERVISRDELLAKVWGYNSYPTTRKVDAQILKLRQSLELKASEPRHLQTVHGAGYKFVP